MKILIEESTLRQAFAALIRVENVEGWYYFGCELLDALRTALDAAEKVEPVAWLHSQRSDSDVITDKVKHVWNGVAVGREAQYTIPLYTHPAPAVPNSLTRSLRPTNGPMDISDIGFDREEQTPALAAHLTAFLRRLEQEMRYAGWGEKQADNYERAELYAEVCEFLGDK